MPPPKNILEYNLFIKRQSDSHKGQKAWNKGVPFSEETRKKMSESRKGMIFSEEHKKNIGIAALGRDMSKRNTSKGSNHYAWKGGISKNLKYRSWVKNKRNRLKKASVDNGLTHSYNEWNGIKEIYNFTCPRCFKSEPDIKLTIDHMIPLSMGGDDTIENIQPLCKSCNSIKNDKAICYLVR